MSILAVHCRSVRMQFVVAARVAPSWRKDVDFPGTTRRVDSVKDTSAKRQRRECTATANWKLKGNKSRRTLNAGRHGRFSCRIKWSKCTRRGISRAARVSEHLAIQRKHRSFNYYRRQMYWKRCRPNKYKYKWSGGHWGPAVIEIFFFANALYQT